MPYNFTTAQVNRLVTLCSWNETESGPCLNDSEDAMRLWSRFALLEFIADSVGDHAEVRLYYDMIVHLLDDVARRHPEVDSLTGDLLNG